MFLELHLVQNFGPSCLNRDDTNTPKDCQFGGFRRARISSQCLKRAIREYFNSQISEFKDRLGVRTRNLPKKIVDFLVTEGKDETEAKATVKKVLGEFGFKTNEKDLTEVLVFINNETPQQISEFIQDNWDSLTKDKIPKEAKKKLESLSSKIQHDLNPDIALFGRMVASNTDLKVDAAAYVAHALSTHKVDMEMDFFTAMDDLQEETESGAGMMGIILYNSSCFYRYSVLDLNQLRSNLKDEKDLAVSVVKGFLKASINAIPTGKQTSMAAFNKPDFIMAILRSDQPYSLTNAFATPISMGLKKTNIVKESIGELEKYLANITELYGSGDSNIHFCLTDKDQLEYLDIVGSHHATLKDLIDKIGEDVNGSYSA